MRLLIIWLLLPCISLAQFPEYVKTQATILAAPDMYGRGYVNNGVSKAADHIEAEFKSMGLLPVNQVYRQEFSHGVNRFAGEMKLCLDKQELKPGVDFLVEPFSGALKGKYACEYIRLNSNVLEDQVKRALQNGHIPMLDARQQVDPRLNAVQARAWEEKKQAQISWAMQLGYFNPVILLNNNKLTWGGSTTAGEGCLIHVKSDEFKADTKLKVDIENEFVPEFKSTNVMGMVKGTLYPDSFIVFTGHYDHLGMMGAEACFYGANDNASGTAVMMSFAKYYAQNPPACSVVFIAFAGEEIGLVGSQYFVDHPLISLEKIGFLINLDLFASGIEGITVVNSTAVPEEFALLSSINEELDLLPKVKKRGPAANSDHHPFAEEGVPAIFIYAMGGSKAYHDIEDTADKLTFDEYPDIFTLLTTFVDRLNK